MPVPIRVLVADESRSIRLLLTPLLRDDDRFVVVNDVASGAAIQTKLATVDLVVLDLVLEDGDDSRSSKRSASRAPTVATVIVAAVDPPYLRAEAFAHGADAFFNHATDPRVLLDGFVRAVDRAGR